MSAPRKVDPMAMLALKVAVAAPVRRNRYSRSAYIPWTLVQEIRIECSKRGIDWRVLKSTLEEARK